MIKKKGALNIMIRGLWENRWKCDEESSKKYRRTTQNKVILLIIPVQNLILGG